MQKYNQKPMKNFLYSMLFLLAIVGCKEEIDTSDRYVFKEETISSYLEKHPQYSEYLKLLYTVPVSVRSESTVGQLMSARGNYTCFAPTNEAIQTYLEGLVEEGLIAEPSWKAFTDEHKLDSIQKVIVYNSIIDGGDNIAAYETGAFPTTEGAEFTLPNMYDRKLSVRYDDVEDIYYVSNCPLDGTNQNIPATNGVIHAANRVINPSNNSVGHYFSTIIENKKEGYYVMAMLADACGLIDTLDLIRDEAYEELYQTGVLPEKITSVEKSSGDFYTPEHRYYGYTIFAETDEFWSSVIGKPYTDITISDIRDYLLKVNACPGAVDDENYESENNLLNQFVTYHILPERLSTDRLVNHYNERGYSLTAKNPAVPMAEYYTTMGKRRLMKIYQAGTRYSLTGKADVFLNRFPVLDNGRHGTYKELSCVPENEGVLVGVPKTDGENDVRNAVIYPIDKLLTYSDNTRDQLLRSRIRWDVAGMWPEFINNDIRLNENTDIKHLNVYIPSDNMYKYLKDVTISDDTEFDYWTGRGKGWRNYLGDEMTIRGSQDVIFKLPPVPRQGTYELRYAMQCGGIYRTMVQVYFGTDPDNLPAQGIPMDLRQGAHYRYTKGGNYVSDIGWDTDQEDDDDYNAEVDKKMRNNDFMKGCNLICSGAPGVATMMRGDELCLRRILVRQTMDPEKTYYIRFKTVLDDPATYLYMDYFEYCAKEVYDNPSAPEDIW